MTLPHAHPRIGDPSTNLTAGPPAAAQSQRTPYSMTGPEVGLGILAGVGAVILAFGVVLYVTMLYTVTSIVGLLLTAAGLFLTTGSVCTLAALRARVAQDRQRASFGLR